MQELCIALLLDQLIVMPLNQHENGRPESNCYVNVPCCCKKERNYRENTQWTIESKKEIQQGKGK